MYNSQLAGSDSEDELEVSMQFDEMSVREEERLKENEDERRNEDDMENGEQEERSEEDDDDNDIESNELVFRALNNILGYPKLNQLYPTSLRISPLLILL